MSTYLYLECLDHEPPLRAEYESGQHLYDLPRIRAEIADRENVAAGLTHYRFTGSDDFDAAAYFRTHSADFLARHSGCRIGIRDEYGEIHPTTDEDGDAE